jgi:solute carrier family 25 phosphate transporter 3
MMILVDQLKYAAAGGIGACISHSGAVPLDVVKTRVQLNPGKYAGTFFENGALLVREEGPGVLLQGLGSTALGYFFHGALKYGGFESLKFTMYKGGYEDLTSFASDHRLFSLIVAAAIAEFVATLALCPLEQTRIKMTKDKDYADGTIAALTRLFREDGVAGVADSLPAIYCKTIPFTMFQLPVYDVVSKSLRESAGGLEGVVDVPPIAIQLSASLAAALIASLASQPGDTLMSEINGGGAEAEAEAEAEEEEEEEARRAADADADAGSEERGGATATAETTAAAGPGPGPGPGERRERRRRRRRGVLEVAAELGPGGLFVGWRERLAHVASLVVIQLPPYDNIKQFILHVDFGSKM